MRKEVAYQTRLLVVILSYNNISFIATAEFLLFKVLRSTHTASIRLLMYPYFSKFFEHKRLWKKYFQSSTLNSSVLLSNQVKQIKQLEHRAYARNECSFYCYSRSYCARLAVIIILSSK